MNKNLLYLFLFLIAACGEEENPSPTLFFAGEIVTPTHDYVILHKGDMVIDSAKLDENNRFSFSLDSISEGLHYFEHKPEVQYVYLEKGDSLLLRLNTIDFDESLIFTGIGEEINNFLLEVFLANEEEKDVIYPYFQLDPDDFSRKIDSLRSIKTRQLRELHEEFPLSDKALKMAYASIDYNAYVHKELYPFNHKMRTREDKFHALPDNFYDYRKNVSYNDEDLTYLRPYYDYMVNHIRNLTYIGCHHECEGKYSYSIRNELHFNKHKMYLIDSLVQEQGLRDNLFRNVAMDYLIMAHDTEKNNTAFIDEFHKFSGNNKHMDEIDGLYQNLLNIQPEREVPDLAVTDAEGNMTSLKELSQKEHVVFYFWSGTQKGHFRNITRRVSVLSKAHPKYEFVGINIRTDPKRWQSMMETAKLDKSLQYRAENSREFRNKLIINRMNYKALITHKGRIVNAFASLDKSFKKK
ncbi:TlpA family protein disulfide reductase [Spongiimicrobium salis]|uniref:TlpA family protein disulfide reductase n=1 Tax=Spongiimicrobium salis TaxID=1667022 RepID=UPI00374DCA01